MEFKIIINLMMFIAALVALILSNVLMINIDMFVEVITMNVICFSIMIIALFNCININSAIDEAADALADVRD